jgi:hypothetical protein
MGRLVDALASSQPDAVIRRSGETFVSAECVRELIGHAELEGFHLLGLEGFLVDDAAVFPAIGRIADFSCASPEVAVQRARELLAGSWATPPTESDQMHPEAAGRHMIAVVFDD